MTNDVKYTGTMVNDVINKTSLLVTQALDFIMTEDDDYIVVDSSGLMTNDTKY